MADRIDELRARIAELDRELVAAVSRRIDLVTELWHVKEERRLASVDPEQERRLVEALVAANEGALSEAGVRELVDAVLALTKRELGRR